MRAMLVPVRTIWKPYLRQNPKEHLAVGRPSSASPCLSEGWWHTDWMVMWECDLDGVFQSTGRNCLRLLFGLIGRVIIDSQPRFCSAVPF